ncbi:hypothetical protein AF72_05470 [Xylella taiwanensis]|uniref:Uncharacterized protein n=1 Tax=Xylella taiwanensis TaxID=1444770 RepID=Z9JL45_9GAMM|nr:hypothetical protein AF72_05470 [Xylella taiwanensis]
MLYQNDTAPWKTIMETGVLVALWEPDSHCSHVDHRDVAKTATITLTEHRLV